MTATENFKAIIDKISCPECGWETTVPMGQYTEGLTSWEEAVANILSKCWSCGSPLPLKPDHPETKVSRIKCLMCPRTYRVIYLDTNVTSIRSISD